jgi:hypothetical protein
MSNCRIWWLIVFEMEYPPQCDPPREQAFRLAPRGGGFVPIPVIRNSQPNTATHCIASSTCLPSAFHNRSRSLE